MVVFLQIIPEGILERFKGEFPREIKLETQNRRSYKIGVAENKLDTCYNQKLVFSVGWGKFVETFGLQTGDTIVLIYNGNSQFSVIIFDKFGCEKALSVVVDPVPPPLQERRAYGTDTVRSSHFHPQPLQRQPFIAVNGLPVESPPTEGQWCVQMEMDKSCQGSRAAINTPPSESSGLS